MGVSPVNDMKLVDMNSAQLAQRLSQQEHHALVMEIIFGQDSKQHRVALAFMVKIQKMQAAKKATSEGSSRV